MSVDKFYDELFRYRVCMWASVVLLVIPAWSTNTRRFEQWALDEAARERKRDWDRLKQQHFAMERRPYDDSCKQRLGSLKFEPCVSAEAAARLTSVAISQIKEEAKNYCAKYRLEGSDCYKFAVSCEAAKISLSADQFFGTVWNLENRWRPLSRDVTNEDRAAAIETELEKVRNEFVGRYVGPVLWGTIRGQRRVEAELESVSLEKNNVYVFNIGRRGENVVLLCSTRRGNHETVTFDATLFQDKYPGGGLIKWCGLALSDQGSQNSCSWKQKGSAWLRKCDGENEVYMHKLSHQECSGFAILTRSSLDAVAGAIQDDVPCLATVGSSNLNDLALKYYPDSNECAEGKYLSEKYAKVGQGRASACVDIYMFLQSFSDLFKLVFFRPWTTQSVAASWTDKTLPPQIAPVRTSLSRDDGGCIEVRRIGKLCRDAFRMVVNCPLSVTLPEFYSDRALEVLAKALEADMKTWPAFVCQTDALEQFGRTPNSIYAVERESSRVTNNMCGFIVSAEFDCAPSELAGGLVFKFTAKPFRKYTIEMIQDMANLYCERHYVVLHRIKYLLHLGGALKGY